MASLIPHGFLEVYAEARSNTIRCRLCNRELVAPNSLSRAAHMRKHVGDRTVLEWRGPDRGFSPVPWFRCVASEHAAGDAAQGRPWSCACGPCAAARKANWNPPRPLPVLRSVP